MEFYPHSSKKLLSGLVARLFIGAQTALFVAVFLCLGVMGAVRGCRFRWAVDQPVIAQAPVWSRVSGFNTNHRRSAMRVHTTPKSTSRRNIILGAAAAAIAAPATAAHSPIAPMYDTWVAYRAAYNSGLGGDELLSRIIDLENRIMGTPPRSLKDYALKILVTDCDGDLTGSLSQTTLVREAQELAR